MIAVAPETEALARRVAEYKGTTPEQVLKDAVETEARLVGVSVEGPPQPAKSVDLDRVRQITRRSVSRPLIDQRTPKEILNEAWGVPG